MDGPMMLVTDGKRVDWSDKGVPPHIEVYDHGAHVALYDRAKDKHVGMKNPPPPYGIEEALRMLARD